MPGASRPAHPGQLLVPLPVSLPDLEHHFHRVTPGNPGPQADPATGAGSEVEKQQIREAASAVSRAGMKPSHVRHGPVPGTSGRTGSMNSSIHDSGCKTRGGPNRRTKE